MRNKLLFFFLISLCTVTVSGYAQSSGDSLPSVPDPEKKAEFKGGMTAWIKFLEKSLDRDLLYKKNAPNGTYRVTGNFLVDTLGNVSDIRIKTDPGYTTANEFIRVIKLSSGKWLPAIDHGVAVPFRHIQSISLMINGR